MRSIIRIRPHIKARLRRHRQFEAEGKQPIRYDGITPIYGPKKGDRKCAICARWFVPMRPWAAMSNPVPVCYPCERNVPVGMGRVMRGHHTHLTHGEAVSYGPLLASMRAALWHLEREIEQQSQHTKPR